MQPVVLGELAEGAKEAACMNAKEELKGRIFVANNEQWIKAAVHKGLVKSLEGNGKGI